MTTDEERFLRELILQELGRVRPNYFKESLALICRTVMEKSSSNGRKRGTWLNRGRTFPYPRSLAARKLDASPIVSSSTPGRCYV